MRIKIKFCCNEAYAPDHCIDIEKVLFVVLGEQKRYVVYEGGKSYFCRILGLFKGRWMSLDVKYLGDKVRDAVDFVEKLEDKKEIYQPKTDEEIWRMFFKRGD